MVSQEHAYIQTHQIVHIKCAGFFMSIKPTEAVKKQKKKSLGQQKAEKDIISVRSVKKPMKVPQMTVNFFVFIQGGAKVPLQCLHGK